MRASAFLAVVAAGLFGAERTPAAQDAFSASDTAGVELAVAFHLRERRPTRRISFQDFVGPFIAQSEPAQRSPERISAILAALGDQIERHPIERSCTPSPGGDCLDLVVRFDNPTVLGDSATVLIHALVPTSPHQAWSELVLIRRQGAGWVFGRVVYINVALGGRSSSPAGEMGAHSWLATQAGQADRAIASGRPAPSP